MLFDFVLNTFTDAGNAANQVQSTVIADKSTSLTPQPQITNAISSEKLRVKVKLSSIILVLNDDGIRLATLSLSAGDVSVLLKGPTMRVNGRLGNLSLLDDLKNSESENLYTELLTIEGNEVAEFTYETYDPLDHTTYPGYDTLFSLRSGSFKFTIVEDTLHLLLRFLTKFARMKAVLDAARDAAAHQAAELQGRVSKMHYDILVRTPIIVFPRHPTSRDKLVAHLGEIRAENRFINNETKITAGIYKINFISDLVHEEHVHTLDMIDDVNLELDVTTVDEVDRSKEPSRPETFVSAFVSNRMARLTGRIGPSDIVGYSNET